MARAFAKRFYSSRQWQSCRNEYANKVHHLCERCLERGIIKPGVIVHHVIELTPQNIDDPNITLNHDNLQMLCRECHNEEHDIHGRWSAINARRKQEKQDKMRYVIGDDGKILIK